MEAKKLDPTAPIEDFTQYDHDKQKDYWNLDYYIDMLRPTESRLLPYSVKEQELSRVLAAGLEDTINQIVENFSNGLESQVEVAYYTKKKKQRKVKFKTVSLDQMNKKEKNAFYRAYYYRFLKMDYYADYLIFNSDTTKSNRLTTFDEENLQERYYSSTRETNLVGEASYVHFCIKNDIYSYNDFNETSGLQMIEKQAINDGYYHDFLDDHEELLDYDNVKDLEQHDPIYLEIYNLVHDGYSKMEICRELCITKQDLKQLYGEIQEILSEYLYENDVKTSEFESVEQSEPIALKTCNRCNLTMDIHFFRQR